MTESPNANEQEFEQSQPGDLAANPPSATDRQLAKSSSVMAAGTVLSRVTGIGRDIAMTAALGFFLVSDAYSLGNSLPNIVYILVVGGALNAVFIPQLVRHMKDDADNGQGYANRLLTITGVALLALAVLSVVLAPWIVDLYTPDDYPQSQLELATAFARLCLPQIFFYGIYAMLSQVLNARGRFGAPMFAPIANNIIAIATFVLFLVIAGTSAAADGVLTTDQVLLLGIGTTLGVAVQALILIPVLMRTGFGFKPMFDWRGAGLGKSGTLAMWTIGLVLVNQLAYIVITRLATQANVDAALSGTVAAGLTTYQKAHLVFVLPHSVITVSIVTALLPALSRVAHSGNLRQVGLDIGTTMRMVAMLIVPVSAVLILLGPQISVLLFGYGAATAAQAGLMGVIVSLFVLGLLPFTLFYVLLRGFYSLEDTKTPFWVTVAFNVVYLALAIPLFEYFLSGGQQVAMLALSYSIAYWLVFILTWALLHRRLGTVDTARTVKMLLRVLIAALIAAAVMFGTQVLMSTFVTGRGIEDKFGVLLNVIVVSIVGLAVFIAAARTLRVSEMTAVLGLVGAKLRRGR